MNVANKIALITGASRGIGKAIALTLAKSGVTTIGTATSQVGADNISAYLEQAGTLGRGLVLNVTEQASIDAALATIQSDFGAPTILVNNAAIARDNLMLRMKDEEWDSIIDTNLSSVYRMTKACLKGMMKAKWGRIINISSVVGLMGNAGQANYCAAKAGLIGFTKSLAHEIGSRGITVNAIAPGFIETDMTSDMPEAARDALMSKIPLQRLGQPDDIAQCALFLSSEGAGYITGETISVNGGMYMQ